MSSRVLSAALVGLDAELVEVEAETGGGEMGAFSIVGLPDAAVSESRERVRSAVKNSGFEFPRIKVTVNLAPADLKKQGPSYDLPIAVSILLATEKVKDLKGAGDSLFVGELALSGEVRPVNGVLPIAIKAKEAGLKTVYAPACNAKEAGLVPGISVVPIKHLRELCEHLMRRSDILPAEGGQVSFKNREIMFDMKHVKGQERVKRAMIIAAAGAHNMLMSGPPGSGKTLIARTMPSILPDLTLDEALELTKIYSVAGRLPQGSSLVTERPFRSPHHTASGTALVGGGTWPKPGEVSLSHRGVLFLDEFAEFPRHVLENLRQPLEEGFINISRAAGNLTFPAKFILVAAMNPCPCGFSGDKERECCCTRHQVNQYRRKISGPILDRIDLHVEVPRVGFDHLVSDKQEKDSRSIKEKVEAALAIQRERFKGTPFFANSEMSSESVKKFCQTDQQSIATLKDAVDKLQLSARSYFRVLKVARTIADLDGKVLITEEHIGESLQFRPNLD